MARFEFTVPTLADPDLRVRLDTAADNSGTSVTDVLIGDRAADSAQGFDLRGVVTFLGPDGVDTLYLKALNYRGKVIGASIALAGVASGGGSVPSTVVRSFDVEAKPSGINTALVAGVSTGIVIPAGSVVALYQTLICSSPAAWDGDSPALALGATALEAAANVLAGVAYFDLTAPDVPAAVTGAVLPKNVTSTAPGWYFPTETTLWVALGIEGAGGDPGSTTGTAKLLVAYTPPAA